MADHDLCGYTLGDFVLRERIGEGGFGTVYRGEQPLFKRDVVVKVLHQQLRHDGVARQRFMREAQLASRLDHPYAAHIYAFGVDHKDGLPWIAMELVQGVVFKQWLATHGRMSLEQFVPFFECIAQVVQAAHARGIVHRDLKPSNVMVTESAGQLFPKLLDLGIAKVHHTAALPVPEIGKDESATGMATEPIRATPPWQARVDPGSGSPADMDRLTPSHARMGSPAYMAPEQWSNADRVGPAADIYALGIVAYEALTGYTPFLAETDDEYYQRHRYDPVPRIFSPDLDRIFQRALAKQPEDRHGNVLELASALRAALRASQREQLRTSAQRWEDRGRPPGLLWGRDVLADLEYRGELGELECSFLADSWRRVRRVRWARRSLVVIVAAIVVAAVEYRAATKTWTAQQLVTQAELEQGRSALLHGEPEAVPHLAEAYKRAPSRSTAFMLARALQPRLAEQARFASSAGRMWSAAFSPDGKQIVTTDDKRARVWDAQSHRLLFTLAHGDTVYQAVYSSDGTQIITAGGDGVIRIWDAADGSSVRKLTREEKRRYYAVAMPPDGKFVAAIDLTGGVVHIWAADSGAPLAEIRNDALDFPGLAISADGRWLATSGGSDVGVFDTRTWTQAHTIPGPRIYSLSFDPTGPYLATGTASGDAAIWAIPSGERVRHLREIGEPVDAVVFSPDGSLVVVASRDGAEQVWDARSGTLRSQGNYLRGRILSIEFDRTSKLVAAAGASGVVVVADAALGMPVTVLEGPQNVVRTAHFDPSSRRVVGASWDGTARVWDATSPYLRWSSPPISDDGCGIIPSLEPDRRFIAIGCRGHNTRVWDTARDQLLAELPAVTHVDGEFTSAFPAVSATGDMAAVARGNAVEVYELPGGRLLRTIAHGAPINALAFASTGRDLVSGAVDGSLLITRDSRDPIALPTSPGGIDTAGFLPDGRVVATAGMRLRIYNPDDAVVLADLELPTRARTLRMSPEGLRLITVPSYLGKAAPPALWDLRHYRLIARLEGQIGQVYSARFVAGGREIVTAGGDGAARLWDGATGQLLQTYRGGSRFLVEATLSPDGSMIVAGGGDGVLRFWDTASGRSLWTMPAHKSHLIGLHFEGEEIVTRGFAGEISRWFLPKPEEVIEAYGGRDARAIMQQ